jgi:hypothetical protein
MNIRLNRIPSLMVCFTAFVAVMSLATGLTRPVGIILGGLAAWFDFVVIKRLAAALIARRPATTHLVPLAFAKSIVLVSVPAIALFLPSTVVDGVSFAIGVTTLPVAVVVDAFLAIPEIKVGEV